MHSLLFPTRTYEYADTYVLFVIRQLEQYLAPSRGESLGGRWDLLEVRRLLYFGHDMFDYSTVCISVLIALISFP